MDSPRDDLAAISKWFRMKSPQHAAIRRIDSHINKLQKANRELRKKVEEQEIELRRILSVSVPPTKSRRRYIPDENLR